MTSLSSSNNQTSLGNDKASLGNDKASLGNDKASLGGRKASIGYDSISVHMNIDEIDFMLTNLASKLEHQKHVVAILSSKQKSKSNLKGSVSNSNIVADTSGGSNLKGSVSDSVSSKPIRESNLMTSLGNHHDAATTCNRQDALLLKTARRKLDKIQTDIEMLNVLKKQLEMGVEDDQWLLDSPVYLSTIQKMKLKYASLIEAAARL
jgi:hypothetical protein